MRTFLSGIVAAFLLIVIIGFGYIEMGYMPVATSAKPLPLEAFIAHTSLHAALKAERTKLAPIPASETNLRAGARVYHRDCAVCHGAPGATETAIAKGMFPPPPQLFEPHHRVTDDPIGTIFWKVKNGIRLTGMPGFHDSLSDEQIWQTALLLKNADHISDTVKDELR